jgi:glycosyltransferase involved in cell wall biosynthesis
MKIAINIDGQFLRRTGIQYYVDSLLNALYQLNSEHVITALAPSVWSKSMWKEALTDNFFEWRRLPNAHINTIGNDLQLSVNPLFSRSPLFRKIGHGVDGRIVNPIKMNTMAQRMKRAANSYDVLHIPDAASPMLLKHPGKCNIATIYDITTITCPEAHGDEGKRIWGEYFAYAQKHCARIITISEHSKQDIVEHLRIPADRIDVTPLAPRSSTQRLQDPALTAPVLRKLGLEDKPFVLYAGTLEPRKNLERLLKAFADVIKQHRWKDVNLVLAGGSRGDYGLTLSHLAHALDISPCLIMPGYITNFEMNALMSSCAAFAYVSEYEGFGLPPLEAMVCGAPVVSSNTTSLPEVVGDAGLQVDPMDVEAIAGALHLLLTDSQENQRRRALSLQRAQLFSWEKTARLTLQSYEAAVA